ncbi:hypothetical protein AALP_AA6G224100 [Arabis alpina]|uniref:Uncharacterized protein n=1 Tax=Arabis alpina TaxID=50452 RepID=A0A087GQZ4_ARAAL|nr:hypothetical protein AALP_AA6G224100 [Arabis alpina]
MAKMLGFFVILSICLLTRAQEEFMPPLTSPAVSPKPEHLGDSPPPSSSSQHESSQSPQPDSSPSAEPESSQSPQPDSSLSPEPEPPADTPSPPPPPPPPSQPDFPSAPSPSPGSAPAPAPSDDDDDSDDDDSEPETEYFPSPAPAPEMGIAAEIKASEDGEEYDEPSGEDSGMSGLKKAGIAIGTILGVGAIVIGVLIYKKRRDNLTRARYTYFNNQGEFL